jgi:hypothetical protein
VRSAPRSGGAGGRTRPGKAARSAVVTALVCAVLLALAGCGAVTSPGDPAVTSATAGGVSARLTMSPEPAPVMEPLRLSVALEDAGGRPLAGRAVAFDLSMPSMTMAANRPAVSETAAGVYSATTLLSMAGEWRLTVEVDGSGGPIELSFALTAD